MCGRYSLAMRPSHVRAYVERDHMPVWEAPEDDGDDAPRQTYNFAPTYRGLVYRADVPDWGAGPHSEHHHREDEGEAADEDVAGPSQPTDEDAAGPSQPAAAGETSTEKEVHYKLQTMKWGLIPFWTKRNPDYATTLKTINCRAESLLENRGLWTTMKQRKRCVVLVEGFYEWLKKGREKIPHYVRRTDGKLMCLAGLWDCVQFEGEERLYTYTIITTQSNKELGFLHDRMPVVLENGSEEMWHWLDPGRYSWTNELQGVLRPYGGVLEVYPVSKEVGKVGNNSPDFVVPIASRENRNNIANFFSEVKKGKEVPKEERGEKVVKAETTKEDQDEKGDFKGETTKKEQDEKGKFKDEAMKKGEDEKGDLKRETTKKEEQDEKGKFKNETVKKDEYTKSEYKPIKYEPTDFKSPIHNVTEDNALRSPLKSESKQGIKREHDGSLDVAGPTKKATRMSASPVETKESPSKPTTGRKMRSATKNDRGVIAPKTPKRGIEKGTQKITGFFGKR